MVKYDRGYHETEGRAYLELAGTRYYCRWYFIKDLMRHLTGIDDRDHSLPIGALECTVLRCTGCSHDL